MSHVARLRRTGSQNKTNYYNNQLVSHFKPERGVIPDLQEDVPSGSIMAYTGTTDPYGWYICDGRELPIQYNSSLFNAISNQYGGDGVLTFRLPDLRGSFLRGAGTNGASPEYTGSMNNFQTHATQTHHHGVTDPSHNHGVTDPSHNHGVNDPGHIHTQTTINDDYNNSGTNPPGFSQDSAGTKTWSNINPSYTNITIKGNTTGISVNSSFTGITTTDVMTSDVSGNPIVRTHDRETRPFNFGINWIIKAYGSSTHNIR
jgi:microcystin-dependent protein